MANALGKGLSALIAESPKTNNPTIEALKDGEVRQVSVQNIVPGKYQARRTFDEADLQELANSIQENGVVQPILIRKLAGKNQFEIVAGERRWRATKLAGITEIPAIIRELDDKKTMEIGLIENIQRENLNMIEEAEGYQRLLAEFSYTQEDLSQVLGKSRSAISNTIRLLQLPDEVKRLVHDEKISGGHARALLGATNPLEMAQTVLKKGLNVRQTEQLVKKESGSKTSSVPSPRGDKDPDIVNLEEEISGQLGLRVTIDPQKDDAGSVSIRYSSMMELDTILRRLG